MKSLLVLIVVLCFQIANAQSFLDGGVSEADIHDRAKKKAYAGGQDEEDLQVIEEFNAPYSVVNVRQIQQEVYENVLKSLEEEKVEGEDSSSATEAN
ncbi:MAG: hypothetical protein CL677_09165 [Bdellovibrionaceae bacterium]|nr:hypothetical protein [Pseudobdellovibrionaceae bacterium]|tara:strand:+ start:37062 stop:37352 length:291 start_codon:yes stop_codon:yes gene_type:complete